jgi:hypothetical protein
MNRDYLVEGLQVLLHQLLMCQASWASKSMSLQGQVRAFKQDHRWPARRAGVGVQGGEEHMQQRTYLGSISTKVVGIQYYEGHVSNREMVLCCRCNTLRCWLRQCSAW